MNTPQSNLTDRIDHYLRPAGSAGQLSLITRLGRLSILTWILFVGYDAFSYWDLRFQIVAAPTNALQCSTARWTIQVRNAGNTDSDNVCFFTGIGLHRGASNWTDVLGFRNFGSGRIPGGQTRTFDVEGYSIPCGALTGRQYVKVEINYFPGGCFDFNYEGNYDVEPITIQKGFWDLRFELINLPTNGVTGGTVDWAVRVSNVGNLPSENVCFFTGIGRYPGPGNWAQNLGLFNFTSGNILPGGSATFPVNNYFISSEALLISQYVKVEINYDPGGCRDTNFAGNYAEAPIPISRGFWDIQFQIINAPDTGYICSNVNWQVTVTNAGNLPSQDVCFFTGIDRYPGPGNWINNLGQVFFSTGVIAPGDRRTFDINYYRIACGAVETEQFLKAEINYTAGCSDPATSGNYVEVPITIRAHPNCPNCSTIGPLPDSGQTTNRNYYGYLNVSFGPSTAKIAGAGYHWRGNTNNFWYTNEVRFEVEPQADFFLHFKGGIQEFLTPDDIKVRLLKGQTNSSFGLYRSPGRLEWNAGSDPRLRGSPGSTYRIESTPRLDPTSIWSSVRTQYLAEDSLPLIGLRPVTPTNLFLRAVVLTNLPPLGNAP